MKKLLSTLMVIACLALAIPAQAQIKIWSKSRFERFQNCIFLKRHSVQITEQDSL